MVSCRIVLLCTVLSSGVLFAGDTAYSIPAGTAGNQNFGGELGMDFDVVTPISVTSLGCFDASSNGINGTITVRLFVRNNNGTPAVPGDDSGGAVLATETFTTGSPGTLIGGSRFKPLATPVTLAAGSYTISASGYNAAELNANSGGAAGPSTLATVTLTATVSGASSSFPGVPYNLNLVSGASSHLVYRGGGRFGFTTGVFPPNVDGGPVNRYGAGTFEFSPGTGTPVALAGWTVDWNDGSPLQPVATPGNPTTVPHTYAAGSYTISATPNVAPTILADNPILYWRLDETAGATANDLSAANNDGTFAGSHALNQPGAVQGAANASVDFSGGTCTAGAAPVLQDNFTVEFWIRPDFLTDFNQDIGSAWGEFYFETTSLGGVFVGQTTAASGRILPAESGNNVLQVGTWTHIAYTFARIGATATGAGNLYVNGRLRFTKTVDRGNAWSAFAITNNVDGRVDEVALFNTALSADRIGAHYLAGATPARTQMVNVANLPPAVSNVTVTGTINEGGTATLAGNITDSPLDSFILTIDWADGTTPQIVNLPAGSTSFSVPHVYADDGPSPGNGTASDVYAVSFTLADNGGQSIFYPPNYSAAVTSDAPVAWYRMGDAAGTVAADSSGNGNNATFVNIDPANFAQSGPVASAVRFDGVNDHVIMPPPIWGPYPTAGSTTAYVRSFEIWFNTTTGGVILGQVGAGHVPALYVDTTGRIRGQMFWHGAVTQLITPVGTDYRNGQWHHVMQVYDNGTERLYVDGQLVGTQAQAQFGYSATYTYFLGTGETGGWPGAPGGYWYFNGLLSEAAVYSTALTAQDALDHFSAGVSLSVRVNNVAPVGSNFNLSASTINEGATVTLTGDVAEPGTQDVVTVTVTWADGVVQTVPLALGATNFSLNHTYADDGPSPGNGTPSDVSYVNIVLSDDDGGEFSDNATISSVLASAPLAVYRLGEVGGTVAADVTGVFPGTYQNFAAGDFAQPGALTGDTDTAVTFDGVDNIISVPDAPALRLIDNYSIELWMFKTAEAPDWQRLVGKGDNSTRNYGVWEEFGAGRRILFQVMTPMGFFNLFSVTQTNLNQWYHIVATLQGGTARLYINGVLDISAPYTFGVPFTTTDPLTIGAAPTMHTFFPGRLDEVALYDRVLTPAEVAAHYAGRTFTARTVTVNNVLPLASIAAAPTLLVEGDLAQFSGNAFDLGAGDLLTYGWTIQRNGTTINGGATQNYMFTPSLAGSYTATLTVTDDDTGVSLPVQASFDVVGRLQVVSGPVAAPPVGVAAEPVNFAIATNLTPTAVTWDFGDGTAGNAAQVTHTYAAAGTYAVSVTVTYLGGQQITRTLQYTVKTPGAGALSGDNNADGVVTDIDLDTDGDGFADYLETALAKEPTLAANTPLDGRLGVPNSFTLYTAKFVLDRANQYRDSAELIGALPVPGDFVRTGQVVLLDINGEVMTHKLAKNGKSNRGGDKFRVASKLSRKGPVPPAGEILFHAQSKKKNYTPMMLANAPLDAAGMPTNVTVMLLFNGKLYRQHIPVTFAQGKKGLWFASFTR